MVILFAIHRQAFGEWLPQSTEDGIWLYSAVAVVVLGNLLVTPYFTRPADTVAYVVAALVALFSVSGWSGEAPVDGDEYFWWAVVGVNVAILTTASLAILMKPPHGQETKTSRLAFILTTAIGNPSVIFTTLIAYLIFAYHRDSTDEALLVAASWAIVVPIRPLERILELGQRIQRLWRQLSLRSSLGIVVGHHAPNIVLFQERQGESTRLGDLIETRDESGSRTVAMVLDSVGYSEGRWQRALVLQSEESPSDLTDGKSDSPHVFQFESRDSFENEIWLQRESLIGLVGPNSDNTTINVEIIRDDLEIRIGNLLSVQQSLSEKPVLYQITNGITQEELVEQKNRNGYVRAEARKLGIWEADSSNFTFAQWVPNLNSPVYLLAESSSGSSPDAIGYVPGTSFPLDVQSVNELVTHNTAILGVLGSGKSYLCMELVERLATSGIKVVCVDLTDQYQQGLTPYVDSTKEELEISELQSTGPPGRTNVSLNVQEGGSQNQFRSKLREILSEFLTDNSARMVKIINPSDYEVWRQDSRPYQGNASMATLTPAAITSLVSEILLELLQEGQSVSEQDQDARCCLVFEEAHALIPEWSAVTAEGDQSASNATARSILQGRKYGLGCIVVTQRTANVTKSILNQCNTVFALRVFDATGMEFLGNYIGRDYAGLLSTLPDRQAVAYGRALSCSDPMLVQLNDRLSFLSNARPGDAEE